MSTAPLAPAGSASAGWFEIRLLGSPRVVVDGTPIEAFASPRVRCLVAYLVMHRGGPVSRRRLASEFWPESPESQARTNLRNLLFSVRHAHACFDDAIDVTPTSLQWRERSWTAIDVDRFSSASEDALAADPDDVERLIECCRGAIECYEGDLLPDDAEGWLVPLREDLADRHSSVLHLLATALIDSERAVGALAVTRRLVRARPLDEIAHRLHIEAHVAVGDRSGAVRAYHECVAVLDRELGVAPGADTRRRFEELVERSESSVPDQRPTAGHTTGLVGRSGAWNQLERAWQAAMTEGARLALVEGEPGIGKSRLVEEFSASCRTEGAAVAVARSYLAEGELAFAVVASWLRAGSLAAGLRRLPDDDRRHLARLLPELGPPIATADLHESERRRQMFDSAVRVLGDNGPTLLVADDMQWGDRASHELIHYLIRERLDAPLLVVATARSEDIDIGHPLSALRDSFAAVDRSLVVELEPLAPAETARLGETLVGRALGDDAAAGLVAESGGIPLFVVEAVRSGWDGSGRPIGDSPRLRAVIQRRLSVLTEAAREVAAVAAVIGRPFAPDLVRAVVDVDDRSLAQALDELWRRNILRESATDSYDFSHARIREAAVSYLSPASRRAMHATLAAALANSAGDLLVGEIATHLEAAGRPDEAMVWMQRAIERAQQLSAYSDAVRLCERAQELIPRLAPNIRHERELELLSIVPIALAGVDGYGTDRMADVHGRAVGVAAALGVDLDPAFVRSMVMSSLCRDEFDPAGDMARRLHDRAVSTGDEALRLESRYLLGIAAFWAADLGSAREHFETVADGFDDGGRRVHHARFGHDPQVVCLSRLANTLWFLGRVAQSRTIAEEAVTLAEQVGHPISRDTAMIFSCLLAVDIGDHALFRELTARFMATEFASVPHQVKREALVGHLDVLDGRVESGLDRIQRALDACDGRNFYPGFQQTIARILVAAYEAAHEPRDGLAAVARALSMGGTQIWVAEHHRIRACFLRATGSGSDEVAAELASAETIARSQSAHGHLRRVIETRKRLTKRS